MQRARLYTHLDELDRALRDLERVLEVTQDNDLTDDCASDDGEYQAGAMIGRGPR